MREASRVRFRRRYCQGRNGSTFEQRMCSSVRPQADANQSRLSAHQAQLSAQQAGTEKAAMPTILPDQLNKMLQTRYSARGLIVSMSDVMFDTGNHSLTTGARER